MVDLFGEEEKPQERDDQTLDMLGGFDAPAPQPMQPPQTIVPSATSAQHAHSSAFDDYTILPSYANTTLKGHDKAQQDLLSLWKSGRFPHAMALTGTKGIGKATLAFLLARFILYKTDQNQNAQNALLEDVEDSLLIPTDSRSFTQVLSGGHPDLLALGHFFDPSSDEEQSRADYTPLVDDIRKVPSFLTRTAAYGGWRVVIVDNADRMNVSAQNALLKILEEPPKNTLILLITHRLGALLTTIRSRLRVFSMPQLEKETLHHILGQADPSLSHDERDLIAFLSGGSAGRALTLMEDSGAQQCLDTLEFLSNIKDIKLSQANQFADSFGAAGPGKKQRQDKDKALKLWKEMALWLCEKMIEAKAHNINPFKAIDLQDHLSLKLSLQTMIDQGDINQWISVYDDLKSHFETSEQKYLDSYYQVYNGLKIFHRAL